MVRRHAGILAIALLGTVLLVCLAASMAFVLIGPRSVVEFVVARMLGRHVSIGSLRIGWGDPLAIDLSDLRVANLDWGSEPDMITVDNLSALIELSALLRGVVQYDNLVVVRPRLLLERNAAGTVNWHFPGSGSPTAGHLAVIPKNRSQFPTLLDLALSEGTLVLRAAGRRELRIELRNLMIHSLGEDQGATLDLDGAFNGMPAQLAVAGAAFSVMRDRTVPYPSRITIATPAGVSLHFDGAIAEPLDFDGVDGKLEIATPSLGELLKFAEADVALKHPLHLDGAFLKQGQRWRLSDSVGTLARTSFDGTLILTEGGRGEPDAVALDLSSDNLDFERLFDDGRPAAAGPGRDGISLRIDRDPGATIDARITSKRASYGPLHVTDFALQGASAPGNVTVGGLSFTIAGGRLEASGSARAVESGSQLSANISLLGGDAELIAQLAGVGSGQIAGRLNGHASLQMSGNTLTTALKRSRGQVTLAMGTGRVARAFIEKASTDLRALFRTAEGWVPMVCALGIADLRDGIATIDQLRMRTPDTTLLGGGEVDFLARRLDMMIRAESPGSRILALDVPLRLSGDFDKLRVAPVTGAISGNGSVGRQPAAPPDALAKQNPCRD